MPHTFEDAIAKRMSDDAAKREKDLKAEAKRRKEAAEQVDAHEDSTAPDLARAVTRHYQESEKTPDTKEDAS